MNEITLSLETLTVQGIQALDPNDNYCPKQPIFQNTAQCVGVAAVSASLYSDAETAVGANVYHSEKSPELAHQEDLRDISQIHSRVLHFRHCVSPRFDFSICGVFQQTLSNLTEIFTN